jgi:tetratricopeptide (TPR) repeat protein
VLYRKNRLQDASHRYEYALKKIPSTNEKLAENSEQDAEEIYGHANTFTQLRFNFLINLSRCKRKMNVRFLKFLTLLNFIKNFILQEISESIDLATRAIAIKPNNYDGYYARAKGLMEANNLEEAFIDTQRALDKVKTQQKYHKISSDVIETLSRLHTELSKHVNSNEIENHYQTIPDDSIYHQRQSYHAETTDL